MDVFDLMATIDLDSSGYEEKLDQEETKTQKFANNVKQGLTTAGKVASVALGAAATAVGFMTKSAVSGFAEQQQLVGGVQKLYGNMGMSVQEYAASVGQSVQEASGKWQALENAQNTVLENAKNAYKTAGMSANQYMETATSFSAALINSLGGDTQAAANQTDVAMRAISDNFNTFGGDIGNIQNAFQGFAKQNYTMLDNLKLGYGGTKSEMERLIADANEYAAANGQAADLSIDSFSDIVTAIDLVQQKQGIAGTTAREAASTVEGSLGMLKGAWENLLSGLGDADADIGSLVDNVVSSAETVMTNVLPVVEQALSGIGELITRVAPIITEKLPGLIQTVLPPLIQAATQLVLGLVQALPSIVQALIEAIPTIIQTIVSMDWAGFATQIIQAFITGFQSIISMVGITGDMTIEQILDSITKNIGNVLKKGAEIVEKFATGIMSNAPQAITAFFSILTRIVSYIMQHLPQFLQKGVEMVGRIANGIIQGLPAVLSAMGTGLGQLIVRIAQNLPQFLQQGIALVGKIAAGIIQAIPKILSAIAGGVRSMMSSFTSVNWGSVGSNIVNGVAAGIRAGAGAIVSAAASAARAAFNAAKSLLGIKSPSKLFRDKVGKMIGLGMALGITDSIPVVDDAMSDINDELVGGFDDGMDFGTDTVVSSVGDNGITSRSSDNITNYWNITVDGAENPENWANKAVRQMRLKARMA